VIESLAAISCLGAVDTFPGAGTRYFSHPDVTYVPIRDGAFACTATARRAEDDRPLVRGFTRVADLVSSEHRDVVQFAVAPADAPPGSPLEGR
jgi:hypothetical protein